MSRNIALVAMLAIVAAALPAASAGPDLIPVCTKLTCADPDLEMCFATVDHCVDPESPDPEGLANAAVQAVKDLLGPCTCPPPNDPR